ncbi:Tat pathway signal protein [Marinobacter sp. ATCH36]|uniref:Acg family FMN-binding oxidoreductase n=1 Tax=Marinobacter sp. ATCH36 TaxID=2945106 RepID=UPI00202120DB|nr:Tat pathway signal protein [Marinobacter sp. ATCH36]MCL7944700.1 Tat pathway signal protein [Marinobacter sp. ATCH36]
MNYSDTVSEIWCHDELAVSPYDYRALVRYATLAASSHNTQPWIFKLESNRIWVLPDLSRRCPAVDPDDHHLYASLGCATENLLLAAQAAGLKGHPRFDASTTGVQIEFEETTAVRSALFDAIPLRQCSRSEYDGVPLTEKELKQLQDAGHGDGVSVLLMTDGAHKDLVTGFVAKGNDAQFADPAWAHELRSWIRFSGKEAVHSGDGLYGPAMGNPDVPRWLGLLAMKATFSAKNQNKKDRRHIQSSSAIAVIYSETDGIPHWIEAGRCYQRLALQAAALGLRTAFINQPVEVAKLRPEFAHAIGIGDCRPDFIVRIGHGPEMPRSLRRPVEDVLG